ncbi:MAG: DUF4404 family protein [Pirellulales bacterium]
MSELHDKLRQTVAELHAELAALPKVDPEARAVLEGALHDIQQAMNADGGQSAEGASLIARLKQASDSFQESHPTLTGSVGSVIDALGRMGI